MFAKLAHLTVVVVLLIQNVLNALLDIISIQKVCVLRLSHVMLDNIANLLGLNIFAINAHQNVLHAHCLMNQMNSRYHALLVLTLIHLIVLQENVKLLVK